jgi:hypothetical protein
LCKKPHGGIQKAEVVSTKKQVSNRRFFKTMISPMRSMLSEGFIDKLAAKEQCRSPNKPVKVTCADLEDCTME